MKLKGNLSMQIFSFPPIAKPQSKILILGTMPGNDSLKHNEYYAHTRNAFWKIQFTLFNKPMSSNFNDKKKLMLDNNIALWDVLMACQRQGSLDSNILEEIPNDISVFLNQHKQIKHLFFNGQKAHHFFKKHIPNINLPFTILPSTSPAHTMSFENKLKEWKAICAYL